MDASDLKLQGLIDAKDWSGVMHAYAGASDEAFNASDEDQGAFLATHALVYAYLAGDRLQADRLEEKLKDMGRL